MPNRLIITEKPSVARDIASALGGFKEKDSYFESSDSLITWAVGHLVTLAEPEDYDKGYKFWTLQSLPIIPKEFVLKPIKGAKDRLKTIGQLAKKKEVTELINACDAGREGELIFRYIYEYLGLSKDFKRLWLQSMTSGAIIESFKKLKNHEEVDNLADAAKARSRSDWLIGINATRAFTRRFGTLLSIGRVQTPTLGILVDREKRILEFDPQTYYEISAQFAAKDGDYEGKWFIDVPKISKAKKPPLAGDDIKNALELECPKAATDAWDFAGDVYQGDRLEKLSSKEIAQSIVDTVTGKTGKVTKEEHKTSVQKPPLLFDLNELQREANRRFGIRASQTLKLAQTLYEEKKLITYPRTDSKFLPEDYVDVVPEILEKFDDTIYGVHTKQLLKSGIEKNPRIFDSSKISDHFAIIPTAVSPETVSLSEPQKKIYDLIVRRFISVFFPNAVWNVINRVTTVEGHTFRTDAKTLLEPGFLEVLGRKADEEETLPAVKLGESVPCENADFSEKETKPPPRYNDATLLGAMEGAGKFVDDEEMREIMKGKGLGTPATRASIIERLIDVGYVDRSGKDLVPSGKGIQLYDTLLSFPLPELISPEMTGEWESKLTKVEDGKLKSETFMKNIEEFTIDVVSRVKERNSVSASNGDKETEPVGKCPICGGDIIENFRAFGCSNYKGKKKRKKDEEDDSQADEGCKFAIWKTIAGKYITEQLARELLEKRKIGPLSGFRSKAGRPFVATLILEDDGKISFEFDNSGAPVEEEVEVEINPEPIGKCPVCKGEVIETKSAYRCTGYGKSCKLSVGRVILQKGITRDDVSHMLETGKTEKIDGFISRKGRPFSAFLVLADDGKVGFEFEPRKPRAGAQKSSTKKGTTRKTTTRKTTKAKGTKKESA